MIYIKKSIIYIFLAACFFSCSKKEELEKPNLLFIFADQYRRASMGFLNEDPVHTPNIDKLAENGVFFSNAVSNYPLCSPYRAMLFSGKYPLSNGVIANCHSGRTAYGNYLKKDEICFSDVLAQNGYNVGYIGKWHLDGPKPTALGEPIIWDAWCSFDRRHGFDFWYAYGADNNHFRPHYWTTKAKEDERHYIDKWSPEHEANVISNYLENNKNKFRNSEKPFSLFWAINPPHTPFNKVPEKYKVPFEGKSYEDVLNRPNISFTENNTVKAGDHGVAKEIQDAPDYFAQVNGVDEQIGRVIEKLKEEGLYNNTIIVFTSDHGEMLGSHGLMHKNVWFKESFEIPLIVHWPAKLKPKIEDLLISVPDYMPTLLGLLGLGETIPEETEGIDYSNVFFDKEVERPDCQLYFGSEPAEPWTGKRGIRTNKYTFAVNKLSDGSKSYYVYDDENDPFQLKNIYGENKQLDEELNKRLANLLKEMNDPWISKD